MPVVINEFEVVPDTASPTEGSARSPQTETAEPKEPLDLEKIMRQQAERAQRVRAH